MLASTALPTSLRPKIGLILFVSGFCSLVYQVAWFRLARLVFGASTSATAAVVAIFMGGLGLGGYLFGRHVRRVASPLGFYARLELGIAILAASSPLLFELARWIYVTLGGSAVLGVSLGTVVRLALASIVLGGATTLMGGTLPAVAQAIEREGDHGRRDVAWLYGYNTLGAVLGAVATTFLFIELLGIRRSIWLAALVNVLIAIISRRLANDTAVESREPEAVPAPLARGGSGGSRLLLSAAAMVGFLFFLMEIVWYRMLAPVLGGSSYTFGLILSVALAGIGFGGLLYALGPPERRPGWLSLAATCALEALFLALPYAAGDQLALFAAATRQLFVLGFSGLVLSWFLVTAVVVFPASVVAGYQFPLLTALLGSERERVGQDVGLVYAWNTWGAILGSLAGGFGLLPLLGAPRLWWLSAVCLLVLSLLAALGGSRQQLRPKALAALFACMLVTLACCLSAGPSAFWRHNSIGAGRFDARLKGPNDYRREVLRVRHMVAAEADGVESAVALMRHHDLALLVNGKSDGSGRGDAPTTVMSGLIGAALHPNPRNALVIGLGTGATAGWLAAVGSIEKVDVVELEPVVLDFAQQFAAINEGVLGSPKVRIILGDGREWVLAGSQRYDVIFSEPSNPYRAGVADLFSRDFYRAVTRRLEPGGIFLQWLQGYEIDAVAVQTAVATLGSVFPEVEIWQVKRSDLLLVASLTKVAHDLDRERARVESQPFRRALLNTWNVEGLEGLYTGFIGGPELARHLIETSDGRISTDDRPLIEFSFVRNLGRVGSIGLSELQPVARALGAHRPVSAGKAPLADPQGQDTIDWREVDNLRHLRSLMATFSYDPSSRPELSPEEAARRQAREAWSREQLELATRLWQSQPEPPRTLMDRLLLAEGLADRGDAAAETHLDALAQPCPVETHALRSLLEWRRGDAPKAGASMVSALEAARTNGWIVQPVFRRALERASEISAADGRQARAIFEALGQRFSIGLFEELRLSTRMGLALRIDPEALCAAAFAAWEPYPVWEEGFLLDRARCYELTGHPLAARARDELGDFTAATIPSLRQVAGSAVAPSRAEPAPEDDAAPDSR